MTFTLPDGTVQVAEIYVGGHVRRGGLLPERDVGDGKAMYMGWAALTREGARCGRGTSGSS